MATSKKGSGGSKKGGGKKPGGANDWVDNWNHMPKPPKPPKPKPGKK
jgi:hypothetical protein